MKQLILLVLALCIGLNASASDESQKKSDSSLCPAWLAPDSLALSFMGDRLASILYHPKSVKVYRLKMKETVTKNDVEVEPNCVRDAYLGMLDDSKITFLQFALFSPAGSYKLNDVMVMSPYMPILEFEFLSKTNEAAHVLISLSDLTWSVVMDGVRKFHFDYSNEKHINLFCESFLSLK